MSATAAAQPSSDDAEETDGGKQGPPCTDPSSERWAKLGKRFLLAAAAHGSLTLATYLLRILRGGTPAPGAVPPRTKLAVALTSILDSRHSLSFGAFVVAYGVLYRVAARQLADRRQLSPSMRGALAGLAASPAAALLAPFSDSLLDPSSISLHLLAGALVLAGKRRYSPTTMAHAGTAAFVSSCTVLMYAWFFHPSALNRDYRSWISRMADMDVRLLGLLRGFKAGTLTYGVPSRGMDAYCAEHGIDPALGDVGSGFISCERVVHPGIGCATNAGRRAAKGFLAALMLYVPVHVVSQAVGLWAERAARRRKGGVVGEAAPGVTDAERVGGPGGGSTTGGASTGSAVCGDSIASQAAPGDCGAGATTSSAAPPAATDVTSAGPSYSTPSAPSSSPSSAAATPTGLTLHDVAAAGTRAGSGALRSSAFLGAFIGLVWAGVCGHRNACWRDIPRGPLLASFLSGWAVLLEHQRRRPELAVYVAPRALQTVWALLTGAGVVRNVPGASLLICALASSVVMSLYEEDRAGGGGRRMLPPVTVMTGVSSVTAAAPSRGAAAAADDGAPPLHTPDASIDRGSSGEFVAEVVVDGAAGNNNSGSDVGGNGVIYAPPQPTEGSAIDSLESGSSSSFIGDGSAEMRKKKAPRLGAVPPLARGNISGSSCANSIRTLPPPSASTSAASPYLPSVPIPSAPIPSAPIPFGRSAAAAADPFGASLSPSPSQFEAAAPLHAATAAGPSLHHLVGIIVLEDTDPYRSSPPTTRASSPTTAGSPPPDPGAFIVTAHTPAAGRGGGSGDDEVGSEGVDVDPAVTLAAVGEGGSERSEGEEEDGGGVGGKARAGRLPPLLRMALDALLSTE